MYSDKLRRDSPRLVQVGTLLQLPMLLATLLPGCSTIPALAKLAAACTVTSASGLIQRTGYVCSIPFPLSMKTDDMLERR